MFKVIYMSSTSSDSTYTDFSLSLHIEGNWEGEKCTGIHLLKHVTLIVMACKNTKKNDVCTEWNKGNQGFAETFFALPWQNFPKKPLLETSAYPTTMDCSIRWSSAWGRTSTCEPQAWDNECDKGRRSGSRYKSLQTTMAASSYTREIHSRCIHCNMK